MKRHTRQIGIGNETVEFQRLNVYTEMWMDFY